MSISTGRALIDTSALLALANPRDQYHEQSVATARTFTADGGRWIGTTLILAELHGHLLYRRGPQVARSVLGNLLDDSAFRWMDVTVDLVHEANSAWLTAFRDQKFSLTDGVSFALMKREKLHVAFAFDHDFTTAGFELLS